MNIRTSHDRYPDKIIKKKDLVLTLNTSIEKPLEKKISWPTVKFHNLIKEENRQSRFGIKNSPETQYKMNMKDLFSKTKLLRKTTSNFYVKEDTIQKNVQFWTTKTNIVSRNKNSLKDVDSFQNKYIKNALLLKNNICGRNNDAIHLNSGIY